MCSEVDQKNQPILRLKCPFNSQLHKDPLFLTVPGPQKVYFNHCKYAQKRITNLTHFNSKVSLKLNNYIGAPYFSQFQDPNRCRRAHLERDEVLVVPPISSVTEPEPQIGVRHRPRKAAARPEVSRNTRLSARFRVNRYGHQQPSSDWPTGTQALSTKSTGWPKKVSHYQMIKTPS